MAGIWTNQILFRRFPQKSYKGLSGLFIPRRNFSLAADVVERDLENFKLEDLNQQELELLTPMTFMFERRIV